MKKILLVILLSLILLSTGCLKKQNDSPVVNQSDTEIVNPVNNGFELVESDFVLGMKISEIRDIETGVHYLIYTDKEGYAGMGGMCPKYNADGTLFVD